MPRHRFTKEACQRGGQTRAQQASFRDACRLGFERTVERHPFFARKWLRRKLREARWEQEEHGHDATDSEERGGTDVFGTGG